MKSRNLALFVILLITNIASAQSIRHWSCDSLVTAFGRDCYVLNWALDGELLSSSYISIENDSLYNNGFLYNDSLHELRYLLTPLYPTVGTSYLIMSPDWVRVTVMAELWITVPAGNFLSFITEMADTTTGEYLGTNTYADGIGPISMYQLTWGNDTLEIALDNYSVVGGEGIFPLAVGNYWNLVDGIYTGVDPYSGRPPVIFELSQNYPNPFNGKTTIIFATEIPQNAILEIFNSQGRLVDIIGDKHYDAGYHEIVFAPDHLSSGIYYYRLTGIQYTQTYKMILLK